MECYTENKRHPSVPELYSQRGDEDTKDFSNGKNNFKNIFVNIWPPPAGYKAEMILLLDDTVCNRDSVLLEYYGIQWNSF